MYLKVRLISDKLVIADLLLLEVTFQSTSVSLFSDIKRRDLK